MAHAATAPHPVPDPTPGSELLATRLDRAANGLSYGLWSGLIGAIALGTAYLVVLGYISVVIGIGVVALPALLAWLGRLSALFTDKAGFVVGYRLVCPTPPPRDGGVGRRFVQVVTAATTYRRVAWCLVMGVTGVIMGSTIILVVFAFARELTVPLWWWAVPSGEANTALGLPIDTWPQALSTLATAPVYLAIALWVLPTLAIGQARLCSTVLGCTPVNEPLPNAMSAPDEDVLARAVEAPAGDRYAREDPPAQVLPDRLPEISHEARSMTFDQQLNRLTPREAEVLGLIARGMNNSTIAETLVISQAAVLKHIRSIFVKLDLPPAENGHRRVLAVLTYLSQQRSAGSASTTMSKK